MERFLFWLTCKEGRGDLGDIRADSGMSINSPETDSLRSANTSSHLPSIESDREDSARYSERTVGGRGERGRSPHS